MADRAQLEAAAAAGVISADQVAPLHAFLTAAPARPIDPALRGEEELRFIRNFHDVFLAIGIFLLAIGMAIAIGTTVATNATGGEFEPRGVALLTGALSLGGAGVLWVLGEFFARRRRLFLPAIAIVLCFTGFAVVAVCALYGAFVLGQNLEMGGAINELPWSVRTGFLVAAAMMALAPLGFYARFRLPFSLGMVGGGVAFFSLVLAMMTWGEQTLDFLPLLFLILGVLVFLAGVAFDMRDPERATRLSDNGFWLHFVAAPLILNGALGLVSRLFAEDGSSHLPGMVGLLAPVGVSPEAAPAQAAVTLVVVFALGLLSLLINRRALIVSALLTTGIAIGILMNSFGLGAGALAAATLISLGGFVLILGAGWHVARRALLGWVKPDGFWARVFPAESRE